MGRLATALLSMLCGVVLLPGTASPQDGGLRVEQLDDVAPAKGQKELSGIVRSRALPDLWWAHDDSGNGPLLYPLDARGRLVERLRGKRDTRHGGVLVSLAENIDWEDLALHDGLLYVADVGNNDNARRDLGVYVIAEPNPLYTERVRPLRHLPVAYGDQDGFPPPERWHYDCEAVFVSDGALYFVTKRHERGQRKGYVAGTSLYRLDLEGARPGRVNELVAVDAREDLFAPTGADLSPDGQRLAVLTRRRLWIFARPEVGDAWLTGRPEAERSTPLPDRARQAEAVCWDDDRTLRLVTEGDREFFRVTLVE